jgi:hypothetical protein
MPLGFSRLMICQCDLTFGGSGSFVGRGSGTDDGRIGDVELPTGGINILN